MVITMTAGTGVIMWLGELITDRGIGNGMSLLIFTSIAPASRPRSGRSSSSKRLRRSSRSSSLLGLVARGAGGLRRAGPAPDPGAVRQADDRPAHVRRLLDLHPAQGQPGRRHPGHLRLVAALPAGARGQPVRPQQPARLGHLDRRPTWSGATTRIYMRAVLRPDRLLHLLLRGDHVQPDRGRRQHEEVRRLHPGHPGRPADRRVPRLRPVADHAAGRAVPRRSSPSSRSSRSALFNANRSFPFGGTAS